jgi:hypothetical protein
MAVDIRRDRHGGVPEDFECRTVDDRLHGDLLQFKARTQAAYSTKRGLRIPQMDYLSDFLSELPRMRSSLNFPSTRLSE